MLEATSCARATGLAGVNRCVRAGSSSEVFLFDLVRDYTLHDNAAVSLAQGVLVLEVSRPW